MTTTWTGFKPGSAISLTLFSDAHSLGSATVNAEGVAVKTVTIPTDTDPGSHTITAAGLAPDGSPSTASITITVGTAASEPGGSEPGGTEPPESKPQLPHTGADLQAPERVGAVALTVGALVVFSVRRRKTSGSAAR